MLKNVVLVISALCLFIACKPANDVATLSVPEDATARVAFFYAEDCSLCQTLYDDVLEPLVSRCGNNLELKTIRVDTPEGYQVFIEAEGVLIGESGRWNIPTIVVGDTYFIGEDAIRNGLLPHLECVFGEGGNPWPDVPALSALDSQNLLIKPDAPFTGLDAGLEGCITEEEAAVCASPNPIFVLYFAPDECEEACDRTVYDLKYLQGVYPQMFYEVKTIGDNTKLAKAIVDDSGYCCCR